jgi:hypothetical protein
MTAGAKVVVPPPLRIEPWGRGFAVAEYYGVIAAYRTREEAEAEFASIVEARAEAAEETQRASQTGKAAPGQGAHERDRPSGGEHAAPGTDRHGRGRTHARP